MHQKAMEERQNVPADTSVTSRQAERSASTAAVALIDTMSSSLSAAVTLMLLSGPLQGASGAQLLIAVTFYTEGNVRCDQL